VVNHKIAHLNSGQKWWEIAYAANRLWAGKNAPLRCSKGGESGPLGPLRKSVQRRGIALPAAGVTVARNMPRFAANLAYLFADRPLIERFGAAAAAGFDAVELLAPYDTPASAVRSEIARYGLTQLGVNTPFGREGDAGLAAVPGREREWQEAFKRALDYVVAIGGRSVHCLAGRVAAEQRPAAERVFIDNLSRAAEAAAAAGVMLLIEPLNPRDRPGYFLSRVEQAADIVGKVGRSNLRIQFDFYHVQIVGGDLMRRFEAHLPLIGHVQIAAVPSRCEPNEGEINYPEIFALMDRLGYAEFVGCEYRPRARTEDGLAWARPYGIVPRL
jgi:2-dehydrotetronate isomerase